MEDQMQVETSSSMESIDIDAVRRQIEELNNLMRGCKEGGPKASPLETEKLLSQCIFYLEDKVKHIVSEAAVAGSFGPEDLSAFLKRLKEEHTEVQMENNEVSEEIELLTESIMADYNTLESELVRLKYSLDLQGLEKGEMGKCMSCLCKENQLTRENAHVEHKLKMMDLQSRVEEKKMFLKYFQNLDCELNKFDTIQRFEDSLSSIKFIEFDKRCIRLSLKTFFPKLETSQQKFEDAIETSESNHEFLIEFMDGNLETAKVEIFPDDVYVADIVDTAKTFRQLLLQSPVHQTSLEWLICKVQERIVLTTLRRSAVKNINKLRHSAEYIDKDETIVAHFAGGVDAFLQPSQGWPLSGSPLKLKSLKYFDNSTKRISLDFLCKVQEEVNSLDAERRTKLGDFLDAIETALIEQMRLELHSDGR